MTSPDEEGPSSTLPRRQLGRFLRDSREAAGFTLAEAAALVDLSRAALQRLETGQVQKIRKQDAQALCEIYGVDDGETKAAVDLVEQARAKSWFHAYGSLYSGAFNMNRHCSGSSAARGSWRLSTGTWPRSRSSPT